ncbi:MAG: flagellar protein FliS [Rhodospirillales bacterium]|nr:flagellar protein FliS [Rhodospirillales bacterium]
MNNLKPYGVKMTNYTPTAPQQAYRYAGASAQYNNALRTTSPVAMMVIAITKTRHHLRNALQYRVDKKFDLESREKAVAVKRLKALQACVAPDAAPELSRDLFAFYARMIKLLARNRRDASMEERYAVVDRNLQELARKWEKFSKVDPGRTVQAQSGHSVIGTVL